MTFILSILVLLLEALSIAIIIRSVLSWASPGRGNAFAATIYQVTEPILRPLRRIVPIWKGLDFSSLIAIVIIQIIIQLIGLI